MTKKCFFKWLSVISVYPLTLLAIMYTRTAFGLNIYAAVLITFTLLSVLLIYINFSRVLYREKNRTIDESCPEIGDKIVELCIVGKNEGDGIINNLKYYLTFPEFFKITVFDDSSDDGSYEKLLKISGENPERLRVKRLERSGKILHPKGMGVETFIGETKADILLINDADTVIDVRDFENALDYLLSNGLDAVHLSRRNDISDSLATAVSDTEEICNTALKIFGISEWCFPGSGIMLTAAAARILDYSDFVPGDDLEMGRQLKQNGSKAYHFQTLFVHEKAPSNFRDFFSQRSKWCRNIAYHLFENEKFGTYVQVFASALTMFFLFGLTSPLSLAIVFAGIFYTFTGLFSNLLFAGKGFSKSIIPCILNTLQVWIQGAVFTPFYILIYPFKRQRMDYNKSKL